MSTPSKAFGSQAATDVVSIKVQSDGIWTNQLSDALS